MNFYSYIGKTPTEFLTEYINTGLVDIASHDTFPLDLYTYGRKTVHENLWDGVTSKCRGIIVHRETGDVVARPFLKFHNYGSVFLTGEDEAASMGEPVIWEKMDGFMCTQYVWEGRNYIASKGSFHSPHAKWATKEFNRAIVKVGHVDGGSLREGWTLMFEGLNRDLRIVVDYGQRQELVLLAVINNETGEELRPNELREFAKSIGFSTPKLFDISIATATRITLATGIGTHGTGNEVDEGFVLTWYQNGRPPFRLKLKYVEYLRLHRMVTGMNPKAIWEVLSQGQNLDEYVNYSTPWFKEFFLKWQRVLVSAHMQIWLDANKLYQHAQAAVEKKFPEGFATPQELHEGRKYFAQTVSDSELSSLAFAILDGKDLKPLIWKRVKGLTRNAHALRDASQ